MGFILTNCSWGYKRNWEQIHLFHLNCSQAVFHSNSCQSGAIWHIQLSHYTCTTSTLFCPFSFLNSRIFNLIIKFYVVGINFLNQAFDKIPKFNEKMSIIWRKRRQFTYLDFNITSKSTNRSILRIIQLSLCLPREEESVHINLNTWVCTYSCTLLLWPHVVHV